jgi:hypothetical protein
MKKKTVSHGETFVKFLSLGYFVDAMSKTIIPTVEDFIFGHFFDVKTI